MSSLVQHDKLANHGSVESLRSTACHLIFVNHSAVDAEERLQEVMLTSPTVDFRVAHAQQDIVGLISQTLTEVKPHSVQSLWIISGSEFSVNDATTSSKKLTTFLDGRISAWQTAFSSSTICYLLGDDLFEMAEQIERLTGAEVRRDFEFTPQAVFDEVVFIDHATLNFEPLVKEILVLRDANIVTIDPTSDGLQQVAEYLRGRKGVKAIHLFCPGNESSLVLGKALLNSISSKRNYAGVLQDIGGCLAQNGEIRIYNNQFNSHNCGINLIRELSSRLGAFVIVANAKSQELAFDPDFLCRFSPTAIHPTENSEWNRLLPPLQLPDECDIKREIASDSNLLWNADQSELTIRTEFDRVQALGWAMVGFATGGASFALMFQAGLF